jgi:large subunit ribosomal protein L7/L12
VSPSDIDEAEIIVLLRLERKIEAIKRLREQTGMELTAAKDAVEAIERDQQR